jgi:putative two-component system response regulator
MSESPLHPHADAVAALIPRARLLLVDDEESNIRLLERVLARAGHANVRSTTDPCRVSELCAAYEPDLVLLDLHMPRRDGFAVLEELAARAEPEARVPVLVLTGEASVDARLRAFALGARDFLAKPFDEQEVALRIRNLLEARLVCRALARQKAELEACVLERTRALEDAQMEILERLAAAAELRDDDTGEHTQRVAELAARLATALGLPDDRVALLRRAAALHDVGKIGIPDGILLKAGSLAPAEREAMKAHTLLGARILAGGHSAAVLLAERIARSHHERWDGKGYPDGLAGEQIPIEARIVALADVVDALSHARPYRAAWPPERVAAYVRSARGTHFDPAVVDALFGDAAPAPRPAPADRPAPPTALRRRDRVARPA